MQLMRGIQHKSRLVLSALTFSFLLTAPVFAQNAPAAQSDDPTRRELANFDQFLDQHQELAAQLRKNPSLVNDSDFLNSHPDLQTYMQQHPQVRAQLQENPNAFMRDENRYDRREEGRARDPRDSDASRRELASFDQFLDSHREVGEQLRKDPSLIDKSEFLNSHPALQTYLVQHPELRAQLQQNPNAFMQQEDRYDRQENRQDDRRDLSSFDRFLDSHREVAEQLRKDPSLIDKSEFLNSHPALQTYLQQHPEVRAEIQQNPNGFMRQEDRYDRQENRQDDRRYLSSFDRFLDSHREVAEQLRREPSLIDKSEFLNSHPALQTYLQQHPEARAEFQQNPNGFMQQEARYDRHEDGMDRDGSRRISDSFGDFLSSHPNVSKELTKDPSLVKNQEYVQNHPELNDYLSAHPEVRQQLMANPQGFIASAQQFNSNGNKPATTAPAAPAPKAPPTAPKQQP